MVRRVLLLALILFCFLPANPSIGFEAKGQDCSKCHALTDSEASNLLKNVIPGLKVLGVNPSPVKGIWEIYLETMGKKGLAYIDFSKKYFIHGSIISIADRKNLTQERFTDLNRVDVSQIPLNDALVVGDPTAKIKVIAFDDPD
jgi:thiol:disulfide interchange protein DsbC